MKDNNTTPENNTKSVMNGIANAMPGILEVNTTPDMKWQIKHTKGWSDITDSEYQTYKDSNAELRQKPDDAPAMNEVESVEQYAERIYPTHNDPTSDPEQYLLRKALIKGAQWREENPVNPVANPLPNAGIMGINGKLYPISKVAKNGGLKRDIVDLVLNLAAPDDDCMLSDFLHALQYVLNNHAAQLTEVKGEEKLHHLTDEELLKAMQDYHRRQETKQDEGRLKRCQQQKEQLSSLWKAASADQKKWEDAIKEYFDSEHTESIQTFEEFTEQFDLGEHAAPSTHSSSEMVSKEKVVELLNSKAIELKKSEAIWTKAVPHQSNPFTALLTWQTFLTTQILNL